LAKTGTITERISRRATPAHTNRKGRKRHSPECVVEQRLRSPKPLRRLAIPPNSSTSAAAGFGLDMEMETSVRESHAIPGSANAILISAVRAHKQPLRFTPRKLVPTVAHTI
jgi:hypothetical protein